MENNKDYKQQNKIKQNRIKNKSENREINERKESKKTKKEN